MSGRGDASSVTPIERRLIVEKLKEGWSVRDIELLTGRCRTTIQNIKKELGLKDNTGSNQKRIAHFTVHPTQDLRKWFENHGNWEWKDPREQKSEPKKRDFWFRETGSNFRTPYHYPGKVTH